MYKERVVIVVFRPTSLCIEVIVVCSLVPSATLCGVAELHKRNWPGLTGYVACRHVHCMSLPVADDTIQQFFEVNILFINHVSPQFRMYSEGLLNTAVMAIS